MKIPKRAIARSPFPLIAHRANLREQPGESAPCLPPLACECEKERVKIVFRIQGAMHDGTGDPRPTEP
jgi:hypothetical protein